MEKKFRSIFILIGAVFLVLGLSACGNEKGSEKKAAQPAEVGTIEADEKETAAKETGDKEESTVETGDKEDGTVETGGEEDGTVETGGKEESTKEAWSQESGTQETEEGGPTQAGILVAYFSATGTTKGVAGKIADITGADVYEILPAKAYSAEDLEYGDGSSRTSVEMNDPEARPEIGSEKISLEGYSRIYLGYPIWWGEAPRIMSTFVESYSFDDITVIPFCTSGSSEIGGSGDKLAEQAGSGVWLSGKRFGGSVSEEELREWIDGLQ